MKGYKNNPRRFARKASRMANRTKKMNITRPMMRGGIRL